MEHEEYMRQALELARLAMAEGEATVQTSNILKL